MVKPKRSPQIANRTLTIRCEVTPEARDGVILAQGGRQRGFALRLKEGKPIFSIRENEKLYAIAAPEAPPSGHYSMEARLAKDGTMMLAVNGKIVARGSAPGLITMQSMDGLSIGEDTLSAGGDYSPPYPLKGKVESVQVIADRP